MHSWWKEIAQCGRISAPTAIPHNIQHNMTRKFLLSAALPLESCQVPDIAY